MKKTTLALCRTLWPHRSLQTFEDFKIGRLALAKHLALSDISVLSVDPKRYSRQLLLREPSELPSGRVPLYVCELCGDLGCGALTVKVSLTEDGFVWQDFARESHSSGKNGEPPTWADEIMARLGPFLFEAEAYRSLLRPYSH